MSKPEIICLVGESGSGKTTVAKELFKRGYNVLHSYTTRMPRSDNEFGHIFVSEDYWKKVNKDNIIAHTYYCGNHYWATKDQIRGKTVYVIDPVGIEQLRKNTDYKITVIYIKADLETRYSRLLKRERSKYDVSELVQWKILRKIRERVNERIRNDVEAFKTLKVDYVVDNNYYLDDVIKSVVNIIDM